MGDRIIESSREHRVSGPNPRAMVRSKRLDETLERFNEELAGKTVQTLAVFHGKYVQPLEQRIAWLELPWHRKVWYRAQATVLYVKLWIRTKRTPPVVESAAE